MHGEVTVPAVPPAPCLVGTCFVPQHVPATCRGWSRSASRGEGRLRLGRRHHGKFGFGIPVSMGWGRRTGLPKSFCRSKDARCSQVVAGLSPLPPKQQFESPHRAGLSFFLVTGAETRQPWGSGGKKHDKTSEPVWGGHLLAHAATARSWSLLNNEGTSPGCCCFLHMGTGETDH